jgi:type IV secretory pathway VirB10-like protein
MELNKAAIGILAAACVAAGAGGAYLATRTSDPAATASIAATEAAPNAAGVEQSEDVIADDTAAQSSAATPQQQPAAAERRTTTPPPAVAERTSRPNVANSTRTTPARAEQTPPAAETRPVDTRAVEQTRAAEPPAPEAPAPARTAQVEPAAPAEPPAPQFEELVVSADSVIGLEVETSLSSERARVEDEVAARVTRDVKVGDRVAIPAGSKARGEVTLVERGGRVKDRARLGIRFTSVTLADGTRVPLETETIYREGDAPGGESAAKIGGGAIGGAIIGGILGGAKGAAIGSTVGAGAGTTAVLAGGRNAATLPSGTPVTAKLSKPATVTIEDKK